MHNIPDRLSRTANAAPWWATWLSASNTSTFVTLALMTWFAPAISNESVSAAETRLTQRVFAAGLAIAFIAFIMRTVHDARRHRMAKILLANPKDFLAAMTQHNWKGLMFLHADLRVTFAGPPTYHKLSSAEQYDLAKNFLEYLASTDMRWHTPRNLWRTTRRHLLVAIDTIKLCETIVAVAALGLLYILLPVKLIRFVEKQQMRRYVRRTYLP